MMNAELTVENRPAWAASDLVFSMERGNRTTHEDEGCVQILVVLFRVIPVKFCRFPTVYGEEVGPQVIGPQRVEELFEGGMEA